MYYTVNSSSPDFPSPLTIILRLSFYICKRVPETIPFSTSPESLAEAELSGEEADGRDHAVDAADEPRSEGTHRPVVSETPHPPMDGIRTLLHPLEVAQRSRTTTPSERAVCISQEGRVRYVTVPVVSFEIDPPHLFYLIYLFIYLHHHFLLRITA